MPHKNKRRPKNNATWQSFYTKEARNAVLEMYGWDFEAFGTASSSSYPPPEPTLSSPHALFSPTMHPRPITDPDSH